MTGTRRYLKLILLLLPGAAACNMGPTPEGTFPVGNDGKMIAGTADAIRDFVLSGGAANWVREAAIHPSPVHGRVQTYFNDLYLTARRDSRYPMPVGATSAKEIFHDDGRHRGWAVGIKTAAGSGGDTWTWWEGFEPDHKAAVYGVGVGSCEGCHSGAEATDRSLTPSVP